MTSVELGENPSDVALLSFTPELAVPDQHNKPWKINKASSAGLCSFYNRPALTFVSPSISLQSLPGHFYTHRKREIVLK